MALVWYSSWQMECCGDPFAVQDLVEWNLAVHPADDWLNDVIGDDLASQVTHHEDHHDLDAGTHLLRGKVVSIRCAYSRYAPSPGGDPRSLYPVPGTAQIVPVARVDGREALKNDLSFNGYIVELELANGD